MRLLFLAAEPSVGALPRALAALGHEVRLAAPLAGAATGRAVTQVAVPTVHGPQVAEVYVAKRGGVVVYQIGVPRRKRGEAPLSAAEQSIFFSLAAVGLCRALAWTPEVLHALDASAGAALYWLATDGLHDDALGEIATVLSVGEVAAPPAGAGRALRAYGLVPSDAPRLPDTARDALLGLGLAHADRLLADSPAHARRLRTPAGGGLYAELLAAQPDRLTGIAPGLDLAAWDPAHDPALVRRYDAARLDWRAANKRALQKELGLPAQAGTPLFALLTENETPASMAVALPALRALASKHADVQVAVVGPPPPELAADLRAWALAAPEQVAVVRGGGAGRVRRAHAGADALVLATPDAAGGLAVRQALRYGALPVLFSAADDTDFEARDRRQSIAFIVHDYNSGALLEALERARRAYGRAAAWQARQQRGLAAGTQWGVEAAVQAHLALYHQAIRVRKETREQLAGRLTEFPAAG